jgi:hypothetical protein
MTENEVQQLTIECPYCHCKMTTYGPVVRFGDGVVRYDPPFKIETCINCGTKLRKREVSK